MARSDVEQLKHRAEGLSDDARHWVERLTAQLAFAEGLCELHPRQARAWRRRIARASAGAVEAVSNGRTVARLKRAAAEAEAALGPIGKVAKTYTIHCVGHGHIDMNWMWSWPETVAVTNDTFTTVLKLMEEFDDFCYTQSQASVYAIVRDHHPELLEQIRRRVAEGRWEVAAAHWVEGDKNLAGGEALARHLLYTRRFVAELFGLSPEDQPLDWEPDTFGHAITVPTIVSRGGVRRYYMCRGGNWTKPPVFWYRGPDGSRVLVHLDTTWYNGRIEPAAAEAMLAFCKRTGLRDWMYVYGVGDHGGGPTRRDILRAHDMDSWPVFPRFRLATTRAYYEVLEGRGRRWPVIDRELNFEFTGCYTSQSQIKLNNRLGERHMLEAETAAALALRAVGRAYPAEAIRRHWVEVLFSHFHDILPGSGWPETRQFNQGSFQRVAAAAGMIQTHSLRAVAAAADTSFAGRPAGDRPLPERAGIALGAGAGRGTLLGGISSAGHVVAGPRPFVVFNPTAWPRREVVQATVWDVEDGGPGGQPGRFVVRGPDGPAAPAQVVGSGDYWGHRYVEVVFPAEVGGIGYGACAIEPGEAAGGRGCVRCVDDPPRHIPYGAGSPGLENEHLSVRFDPRTGGIVHLVDKATGRDLADADRPMGVLEYVLERPGGMSAWVIHEAQRRQCPLELVSFENVHRGPHLAANRARLKLNDSALTVTYSLAAGQRWLAIDVSARWLERGGREIGTPGLRMRFPLALTGARGRYEVPFGSIRRELHGGEEVPALRWADVTGRCGRSAGGCAVLNDSKHGHSLDGSTLSVTLIRSSYEPDPLPEIGDHAVRLAVVPHGRMLPNAELVRLAAAFNQPLKVVATDAHAGPLPPAAAAVRDVRPANVVLSSLRKAQDDEGLILHLHETDGRAAAARVLLDAELMGRPSEAVEVDLLERPVRGSSARRLAGGVGVAVPARGIAAVKVRFAGRGR